MTDERQPAQTFYAPLPTKAHHRHLKPIELSVPLHQGEGSLHISYRLLKGHANESHEVSCSYGRHPDSDAIESYFSTQDTAVLELRLENQSRHGLKHVRLSGIHIMSVPAQTNPPSPPRVINDTLPDGNLLFEVVPGDVYFGHLSHNAHMVKYLSLITRGIHSGHYNLKTEVHYDIEWHSHVALGLTVLDD